MNAKDWKAQIAALSPDEYECYSKAVESLNDQIMQHVKVDRNFQKPFVVQDIDAPENVSKIVLAQFSEDWTFSIQCIPHEPEKLWCQRKYYDRDKRSAELKSVPKE
jgi:hypothetical protein